MYLRFTAAALLLALPVAQAAPFRVITTATIGPGDVQTWDSDVQGSPVTAELSGQLAGLSRASGGTGFQAGIETFGFNTGLGKANSAGVQVFNDYVVLGNAGAVNIPVVFQFRVRGSLMAYSEGISDATINLGASNVGNFAATIQETNTRAGLSMIYQGSANEVCLCLPNYASFGLGSFFATAPTTVRVNAYDLAGLPDPVLGPDVFDYPLLPGVWDAVRSDPRFVPGADPDILGPFAGGPIGTLFRPESPLAANPVNFPVTVDPNTGRSYMAFPQTEIEVSFDGIWEFETAVRTQGRLAVGLNGQAYPAPGFTYAGVDFSDGLELVGVRIPEGFDASALGDLQVRFADGSRFDIVPVPLPAAAWLFLGALGALVRLRRRP